MYKYGTFIEYISYAYIEIYRVHNIQKLKRSSENQFILLHECLKRFDGLKFSALSINRFSLNLAAHRAT